ncbi:MAG: lipid II flippase MurJ, partial [Planctomycetota bacterium]
MEPRASDDRSEPQAPPSSHVATRHGRLLRRTALVSGLTLGSRVLGFVREVQSAMLFGSASGLFDAFLTAWRVPNLFRRFFGEGALSTSLQTALTEADADRGDEAGRDLFLATLRVTSVVLVGVCILAAAVLWFTPGLAASGLLGEPEGATAAIELAVRVLPFLGVVCLAALVAGGLQVRGTAH